MERRPNAASGNSPAGGRVYLKKTNQAAGIKKAGLDKPGRSVIAPK